MNYAFLLRDYAQREKYKDDAAMLNDVAGEIDRMRSKIAMYEARDARDLEILRGSITEQTLYGVVNSGTLAVYSLQALTSNA